MKKLNPYLLVSALVIFCGASQETESMTRYDNHKMNPKKMEAVKKIITITEVRDKYISEFENGSVKVKSNKVNNQNGLKVFNAKIKESNSHNTQHFYLSVEGKNGETD